MVKRCFFAPLRACGKIGLKLVNKGKLHNYGNHIFTIRKGQNHPNFSQIGHKKVSTVYLNCVLQNFVVAFFTCFVYHL